MLNKQELMNYRLLRGVSQREVAKFGGISNGLVSGIESGNRNITEENHKAYVNGVNLAYEAHKQKAREAKAKEERKAQRAQKVQKATES